MQLFIIVKFKGAERLAFPLTLKKLWYEYTTKSGEELTEIECNHFGYEYEGDKLVSYNNEEFVYNNLGSPTTYKGKAAEWKYGKLLTNYDGNTFEYDGFGKRIKKNDIEYYYYENGELAYSTDGISYFYDETGITGILKNNKRYILRKDAQGNVIAILDNSGTVLARYVYDAWGNHKIIADEENMPLAEANPFRYRGYFYDEETGLYYLNTRYYDPTTGRFISQDSVEYAENEVINGLNLYAYCGNNPVMRVDPNGTDWWSDFCNWWGNAWNTVSSWVSNTWHSVTDWFTQNWDIVVGAIAMTALAAVSIALFGVTGVIAGVVAGAVVGAGFGALNAYVNGDDVSFGALSGLIVGAFSGLGGGGIWGALLAGLAAGSAAFTMSLIGDRVNGREKNFLKAGISAFTAGVFSCFGAPGGNIFQGDEFFVKVVGGIVFSLIFSGYTFVSDFIYDHFIKRGNS
ncbi:MAG: RHS repeat-associated core domain-containing protein [Roseburia sp.]|nr:RHS repeat-associated core domain-containing protein [Roseburia sp.]